MPNCGSVGRNDTGCSHWILASGDLQYNDDAINSIGMTQAAFSVSFTYSSLIYIIYMKLSKYEPNKKKEAPLGGANIKKKKKKLTPIKI